MEKITVLRMPFPPSVNHYYRRWNNRVLISKRGRAYRDLVQALSRQQNAQKFTGEIEVFIQVFYPDNRRRDLDNTLKALLDSLEKAGVYKDDSQIVHLDVIKVGVKRPDGEVVVTVKGAKDETERLSRGGSTGDL